MEEKREIQKKTDMPHRTKFVPLLRLQFFASFLKESSSKMMPMPVRIWPMPAIPEMEELNIGHAIIGHGEGDSVEVVTPSGKTRVYTIAKIAR